VTPLRAGQKLPDKENFATLELVRVTAARLLGLNLKAMLLHSFIFQHRAGVRPYTYIIYLAESCVFIKPVAFPTIYF
jgi:hypothetical protein